MLRGVASQVLTGFVLMALLDAASALQPLTAADDVREAEFRLAVPGGALFTGYTVHRIQIEISSDGLAALRRHPREYVLATVRVAGEAYEEVGIHLKGSTGSFRDVDDKPAFTVDFDQFNPDQKCDGLSKIHLNNSVEDSSYVNERLGADLFRAAGVPTPRVAHAMVELNGRSLGLYVLKEGFTKEFLGLHFTRTDGNLYDVGSGNEVTERMRRNSGAGPDDWSDLGPGGGRAGT
jgi:spore coat protein CotH